VKPSLVLLRRLSILSALGLATGVLVAVPLAMATPGNGNYMRYVPGLTNITGRVYLYQNWSYSGTSMTAGSGQGSNWNNPCITNYGRIPDGWYSLHGPDYHRNDFPGSAIQGRVWYLTDKYLPGCNPPVTRNELFVHTEETSSNGQYCPTPDDDKFCWETAEWDYRSGGCVKVSYPNSGYPPSITVLDYWWTAIGGQHQTYYAYILCVGTCSPP
jgi:hypothetical protein